MEVIQMTETMTVKEQLVQVRAELASKVTELNNLTSANEREEAYIFRIAKEIAEATRLSSIFDKADSIKRSKSELKYYDKETKKVTKEIKAIEKEMAKLEKMDVDFDTDVVDQFLAKWRADVEVFIREAVATKYPEAIANLEGSERYQLATWEEKQEMQSFLEGRFGSAVIYCYGWRGDSMEQKMSEMLDADVVMKKATLLGRITEITGKVSDAELYVAKDGNINGHVKGDKGSAKVQTILAGGYNIQCLHYRLLVNKM